MVIKEEFKLAEAIFADTKVQITSEGRPHLGVPIGSSSYINQFVAQKVQQWSKEIRLLSEICSSQPHAAYAALTHGLSSKWSYLTRTIPNVRHHLQPLDNILWSVFIPVLSGRPPHNDIDMSLFVLPFRLGGLGLTLPSLRADHDFKTSLSVTFPLRDLIQNQHQVYSFAALDGQLSARADIRRERRLEATTEADSLRDDLSPSLQRAMNLAHEPGSSS